MDLAAYETLIRSEAAAKRYLLQFCWKNHQRFCPRCRTRRVYKLKSGRRRCSRCGYTFHDFSRRYINTGGLSCQQWLRLVKLFELDVSVSKAADQLGVSYNTTFKAVNAIRRAILSNALDGRQMLETIMDQESSRGEAEWSLAQTPVFGILERGGWVFVDYLPDLRADNVLHFKMNFQLKTSSFGSVVYTDKYKHYDALVYSGSQRLQPDFIRHEDRGLTIDSLRGFWQYAKLRLKSYKGITPYRFPLYMKELEFRYNHRQDDVFELIIRFLCAFVPDREEGSFF